MKRRVYDLVGMDGRVRRERLRTLDDATFNDLLDTLRTKVNLMLNRQRQSYEEERGFLRKAFFRTAHNLCVAKSLLLRLVKIAEKMGGQVPDELARLTKDAQKFLKEDDEGARANSTEVAESKASCRSRSRKDTGGNSTRQRG